MRTITLYRSVHIYSGDQRSVFMAAIEQCAWENGRVAVGHPTIKHTHKTIGGRDVHVTRLIVDTGNPWWEEWFRVHGPELIVGDLIASGEIEPAVGPHVLAQLRAEWGKRPERRPTDRSDDAGSS